VLDGCRWQVLALAGIALVSKGVVGRGRAGVLLEVNRGYALRQQPLVRSQALFGGWSTVTPEQFDGRCRCTGFKSYNPTQRVVCACTGPPSGDSDDLWRKGPYKTLTGYPVVVDRSDDDPHDRGKYLTIQAQGFPDGPKEAAHYYTLIQPFDDFGQPSMPDFYPDAALGVPDDGFFSFDTTGDHPYPAFKSYSGAVLSSAETLQRRLRS
jgi:hypothetical protein